MGISDTMCGLVPMPRVPMRACSSVTMPLMTCTCKCCCTEWQQHMLMHRWLRTLVTELSKRGCHHHTGEGLKVDMVFNGVQASELRTVAWHKSRYSNPSGNCVEAAQLPAGAVAVRNSRYPDGPALVFTKAEWDAFVLGARDGDFDGAGTW